MKSILAILIIIFSSLKSFGQSDTLHTPKLIIDSTKVANSKIEYPNGLTLLVIYAQKRMKTTFSGLDYEGKLFLSFDVETDGSVSGIRTIEKIPGKENRLIEKIPSDGSTPKCTPAYQNGKPVRVTYNLPIKFSVN